MLPEFPRTLFTLLISSLEEVTVCIPIEPVKVGHIELAQSDHLRGCVWALISLSIDVLLLSNFHSWVAAHHSCRDCSLLISLLHFSILACQSLVVRRHRTNNFCDMNLMPWEKPLVSNWCHSNKWWIMQCMNLQLSHQMTTALTTSHGSRVARTIRSSYPATKALVKSGSRKQAIFEV